MTKANGSYDWNERMKRMEDAIARKWEDHDRMDRNLERLRGSMLEQKENVDNLILTIRSLLDRLPPADPQTAT